MHLNFPGFSLRRSRNIASGNARGREGYPHKISIEYRAVSTRFFLKHENSIHKARFKKSYEFTVVSAYGLVAQFTPTPSSFSFRYCAAIFLEDLQLRSRFD